MKILRLGPLCLLSVRVSEKLGGTAEKSFRPKGMRGLYYFLGGINNGKADTHNLRSCAG